MYKNVIVVRNKLLKIGEKDKKFWFLYYFQLIKIGTTRILGEMINNLIRRNTFNIIYYIMRVYIILLYNNNDYTIPTCYV